MAQFEPCRQSLVYNSTIYVKGDIYNAKIKPKCVEILAENWLNVVLGNFPEGH